MQSSLVSKTSGKYCLHVFLKPGACVSMTLYHKILWEHTVKQCNFVWKYIFLKLGRAVFNHRMLKGSKWIRWWEMRDKKNWNFQKNLETLQKTTITIGLWTTIKINHNNINHLSCTISRRFSSCNISIINYQDTYCFFKGKQV